MKLTCEKARPQLAALLDGALARAPRRHLRRHVQHCGACEAQLSGLTRLRSTLQELGNVSAPDDLGLRLRVAISREAARGENPLLDKLIFGWKNSGRAFTLKWSAGLASSFALLLAMAVLIGMFAAPATVEASDQPLGLSTPPRFLYSAFDSSSLTTGQDEAILVEASIGADGRVYDYRVVAGTLNDATRAQLENILYFSAFQPATLFGQPARGRVVLSFAGVAVHG